MDHNPLVEVVNEDDEVVGSAPIGEVKQKHLIHRIARIFIFNSSGKFYLQQRGLNMDTAPGKWDQSAAGFVDADESYDDAAKRELSEEIGVTGIPLIQIVKYYSEEPNTTVDYLRRFNLIYSGVYDGEITLDPGEVHDGKWIEVDELETWIADAPDDFSDGFKLAYQEYKKATS